MNIDTLCVWVVEGNPVVGTIEQYVEHWEFAHYNDVSVSGFVWTVSSIDGLDQHKVRVTGLGRDGDDFLNYKLTIGNVSIGARIDGRA